MMRCTPLHARSLGSVHLSQGCDEIHLHFDNQRFAKVIGELRFGNILSLRLDVPDAESALAQTKRLFQNATFEYGYVCCPNHYLDSNIDTSNGVEAVGLDISKFLPGFYWANYFSKKLCEKIHLTSNITIPGCIVIELDHGVLICNQAGPDKWRAREFITNANTAMERIGKQWFFQKGVRSVNESGILYKEKDLP